MTATQIAPEVAAKNAEKIAAAKSQVRAKGYASVYLGGAKVHAAVAMTTGWGGHKHPRPLCQRASSQSYGSLLSAGPEVTCKRCIAGLDARNA